MTRKENQTASHDLTKESQPPSDQSWFERPRNINFMIGCLVAICALLVLAELFIDNEHPHFETEKIFGFQAWFGFAAFVSVVYLGRFLRLIVRRDEDYYDT